MQMPVTITPKDAVAKELVATPGMTALLQVCALAKLWGDYSLTVMKNYSAISRAENVRTLHVLAACRDGVALLFPSPTDPRGIGTLLRIEKHVGQLALSPCALYRMLVDGLCQVDLENVDDPPAVGVEGKSTDDIATRIKELERRQRRLSATSREYLRIERELEAIGTRLKQEIAEKELILSRLRKKSG